MSRTRKNLIYAAVSAAIVLAIAALKGLFTSTETQETLRILCDAFFIAGVLFAGVGLLTWAASKGAYDIFSYAGKVIIMKFRPKEDIPKYYDYVQEKNQGRKVWLKELAVCGAVCLAVAGLFLLFID